MPDVPDAFRPPTGSSASFRSLVDPWAERRIPLNGALERGQRRGRLYTLGAGCVGLAVGFVAFQMGSVAVLGLLLDLAGTDLAAALALGVDQLLDRHTADLIVSNGVGQIVGLAPVAIGFAWLHSRDVAGYLRLRPVDVVLLGLALVGLVAAQPVIQWLGAVNQWLLPESWRAYDADQLQLIRTVLSGDFGLPFTLTLLAVVPGLCEELLFRGYAQRQWERALGPAAGVALSGLVFGLYHLRPSHLLPLVVLGAYLAYLTWRTGSVLPAIIVHAVHNGIAVTGATLASHRGYDLDAVQAVDVPGYAVGIGFVFFGAVVYVLHRFAEEKRGGGSQAQTKEPDDTDL